MISLPLLNPERLFNNDPLSYIISTNRQNLIRKLDELPTKSVALKPERIFTHFFQQYCLATPKLLGNASLHHIEDTKVPIKNDFGRQHNRDANILTFRVRFSGDIGLFRFAPDRRRSITPIGDVNNGFLYLQHIVTDITDDSSAEVDNLIQDDLENIYFHLSEIEKQVEKWNAELQDTLQKVIDSKIERYNNIVKLVEDLQIPSDVSGIVTMAKEVKLPRTGKLISPQPSLPTDDAASEYWILSEEDLDITLNAMRAMSKYIESCSSSFLDFSENQMRDLFLAMLNSHYPGCATGETFIGEGRCDIRIVYNNQAVFTAECKIWDGVQYVEPGINQLLGYPSWRDAHAAFLVFSKNHSITGVIEKSRSIFLKHDRLVQHIHDISPSESLYEMRSLKDENSSVFINLLVFNLYS